MASTFQKARNLNSDLTSPIPCTECADMPAPGFSGEGSGVLAYAPQYPVAREEMWYFLLADPADNELLGVTRVSLLEAEYLQSQSKPDTDAVSAASNGTAPSATDKVRTASCSLLDACSAALAPAAGFAVWIM